MDAVHATEKLLPLIDWIVIGLLLAGALLGLRTGLGRAFALLLWLLAALWLGTNLSPRIVSWMPNTTTPDDPQAQLVAYGIVAAVVLFMPILGRMLGGAAGKKKKDKAPPTHKPFGALVGLFNAILLATLMLPFLFMVDAIGKDFGQATSPRCAAGFAENVTYLYPAVHRNALRGKGGAGAPAKAGTDAAGDAGK
jgi:uncharacterized membrane protein required for colicin V production